MWVTSHGEGGSLLEKGGVVVLAVGAFVCNHDVDISLSNNRISHGCNTDTGAFERQSFLQIMPPEEHLIRCWGVMRN